MQFPRQKNAVNNKLTNRTVTNKTHQPNQEYEKVDKRQERRWRAARKILNCSQLPIGSELGLRSRIRNRDRDGFGVRITFSYQVKIRDEVRVRV